MSFIIQFSHWIVFDKYCVVTALGLIGAGQNFFASEAFHALINSRSWACLCESLLLKFRRRRCRSRRPMQRRRRALVGLTRRRIEFGLRQAHIQAILISCQFIDSFRPRVLIWQGRRLLIEIRWTSLDTISVDSLHLGAVSFIFAI